MIRAIDKWLIPWIGSRLRRRPSFEGVRHLVFCVADHFEPFRGEQGDGGRRTEEAKVSGFRFQVSGLNSDAKYTKRDGNALGDVRRWTEQYRAALGSFRDADGRRPRHTFFYPAEDYDAGCIDHLAGFCGEGWGEVEVQLHHRNDTPDGFCEKIELFKRQLQQHGLLGVDSSGRRRFGFVHGNWALCNSRPDGDWCGVNEELGLLSKLGCYADFTFPSAPSPTQPRMVNCIYRAVDRVGSPGGCERGRRIDCRLKTADCRLGEGGGFKDETHPSLRGAMEGSAGNPACIAYGEVIAGRLKPEVGNGVEILESTNQQLANGSNPAGLEFPEVESAPLQASGLRSHPSDSSGLMLITGPVGLRWDGLRPRLENSALTSANMPGVGRVKFWVDTGISVEGRPDWVFVKVHMHGFTELDRRLISDGLPEMHRCLQEYYNDGTNWRLHYATAREMYNAVRALESGHGDDGWRDFEIMPPYKN